MSRPGLKLAQSRARPPRRVIPALLGGLFGGAATGERIATHLSVTADPASVWQRIALYEDVTAQPPLLLGIFMPRPLRTEGNKTRPGELVRCVYDGGELVKRMIAVEPPHRMVFDVVAQRLGIESCVLAQEGSYEIDRVRNGCDVILTTKYRTFLHPRWLWRPLERMVASSLHRHILRSMEMSKRDEALPPLLDTKPRQNPAAAPVAPLRNARARDDTAGQKEPPVPAGPA